MGSARWGLWCRSNSYMKKIKQIYTVNLKCWQKLFEKALIPKVVEKYINTNYGSLENTQCCKHVQSLLIIQFCSHVRSIYNV